MQQFYTSRAGFDALVLEEFSLDGQEDIYRHWHIISDETTKTSIRGVLAIGDVRTKSVRQIVTAVAVGACASFYAEEYLAIYKNPGEEH